MENVKNNFKFMYSDLACVFRKHENSITNSKDYIENCEYFMTHDISSRKIHKMKYECLFGEFYEQMKLAKIWIDIVKNKENTY